MHAPTATLASFLLAASCATAPAIERESARARPPIPSVRALLEVRAPQSPVLAADGALYVRDWVGGVNQVFRVDASRAKEPGARVALTAFEDGVSAFSLSPDGRRLLVSAARGGDEEDQVYVLYARSAGTASIVPLLTRAETVFRPQAWLHDARSFLYAANDATPRDFHLRRFEFDGPEGPSGRSTPVLSAAGSWSAQDATVDGTRVLCARFVSESEVHAYELDVATGELAELGPKPERGATCNTACLGYVPGERAVLLESDALDGRRRVWRHDLESGRATRPLAALEPCELDEARLSEEHDLLAVVVNDRGYGVLRVFRVPSFEELVLPPIERGVVSISDARDRTIVFTLANARTPGVAYAVRVPEEGEATIERLTEPVADGVDLAALVVPELVAYRSFDGLEVQALLYLPAVRDVRERIPFVVHFHGGPEGQHRPGFDRTAQVLASRGFGVLQPNVRGSTGYGRAFHRLDDREKRWDSVKDGVAAARWLVERGYSESGRIAAYGGSYGGFMSVACAIEGADVFGAAVDVVGIVNFETFLEQTAGYRRALREAEYGSLDDRAFLRSISPLARADEIRCPMLVAHGLNDPRVPVGEAMQLAVGLQKRGLDPELYFFPDEGHGFAKLENRVLFHERLVRFLERTIGARAP